MQSTQAGWIYIGHKILGPVVEKDMFKELDSIVVDEVRRLRAAIEAAKATLEAPES